MYIFCYKTCIVSRILICKPLDHCINKPGAFNLTRQHADILEGVNITYIVISKEVF